ncbi:hypothetical protein NX059_003913 [Plenodomus lindquistii]|nr:hypothetical protein NX059_003913 [Plenodomus lindquistii]
MHIHLTTTLLLYCASLSLAAKYACIPNGGGNGLFSICVDFDGGDTVQSRCLPVRIVYTDRFHFEREWMWMWTGELTSDVCVYV